MPKDQTEHEAFRERFADVVSECEMRHVFRDGKLVLIIGRWARGDYEAYFQEMWSTDICLLELKEALRTAGP